jgi:peptide/nickel transport system permease protein
VLTYIVRRLARVGRDADRCHDHRVRSGPAAPGDPARTIAGLLADEAEVERIRTRMGLDQPVPVQYAQFVGRVVQGDLGTSARTRRPVAQEIGARLPKTIELAAVGTVIGSVLGIVAGVVAARHRNRWPTTSSRWAR